MHEFHVNVFLCVRRALIKAGRHLKECGKPPRDDRTRWRQCCFFVYSAHWSFTQDYSSFALRFRESVLLSPIVAYKHAKEQSPWKNNQQITGPQIVKSKSQSEWALAISEDPRWRRIGMRMAAKALPSDLALTIATLHNGASSSAWATRNENCLLGWRRGPTPSRRR